MKYVLIIFAMLVINSRVRSQPCSDCGSIRAFVCDSISGQKIFYAKIVIVGTTRGALVRDTTKQLIVANVHSGTYTCRISGFEHKEKYLPNVTVRTGEETIVHAALARPDTVYITTRPPRNVKLKCKI
jgi:hypothetical protein